MENRISILNEEDRKDGIQPVGRILEELFSLYEIRFPCVRIEVVETPANVF